MLVHLVEAVHAGRGLFGDAADAGGHARPLRRVLAQRLAQQREHDAELDRPCVLGLGHLTELLELGALVHGHRGVAAVVEDHVRAVTAGPREHLLGAPPVLLERLTLPGEDGNALGVVRGAVRPDGDRGSGVVLGREDVARRPSHLGPELDERLDEHRGLDRHVQRAGDASAGERLARAELGTERTEAGHLVLGEVDLLAAERRKGDVGDPEVAARWGASVVVTAPESTGVRAIA